MRVEQPRSSGLGSLMSSMPGRGFTAGSAILPVHLRDEGDDEPRSFAKAAGSTP